MNVVIAAKLNSLWRAEIAALEKKHPDLSVTPLESPEAPAKEPVVAEAELILGTHITEELLRAAKKVEGIAVPFAGVNNLPLETMAKRGIALANAHANARFVAERVLALTLGYFGKLVTYHEDLREGLWHGFAAGEGVTKSWDSIRDMRVAILGTGEIGTWTARMFRPFDCEITGYRRTPAAAEEPFDATRTELLEAIHGRDLVICALPLTEETEGVLGREAFAAMEGSLFVNVGRGAVAEQKALYEALRDGVLRGAALDTWYNYPTGKSPVREPADYPIHKLNNVLLSPHLGGYTPKAVAASIREIFEKADVFIRTGRFPETVDLTRRY